MDHIIPYISSESQASAVFIGAPQKCQNILIASQWQAAVFLHNSHPSVPDITSARQQHLYPRYFWLRSLQWEEMETHHPSLFMSVVWSLLRFFPVLPSPCVLSPSWTHTLSEGGKCPLWCIKAASCMWNTIKFPKWQTFRNLIKVKKCTMKTRLLINPIPHPLFMEKMKSKAC